MKTFEAVKFNFRLTASGSARIPSKYVRFNSDKHRYAMALPLDPLEKVRKGTHQSIGFTVPLERICEPLVPPFEILLFPKMRTR